jgi:hypothetical protein
VKPERDSIEHGRRCLRICVDSDQVSDLPLCSGRLRGRLEAAIGT